MKRSELREIIREEIQNVIDELEVDELVDIEELSVGRAIGKAIGRHKGRDIPSSADYQDAKGKADKSVRNVINRIRKFKKKVHQFRDEE